jgi:hypothetical protein
MELGSERDGPRLGLATPGVAETGKAEQQHRPRGRLGDRAGHRRAALDVVVLDAIDHAGEGSAIAVSGCVRPDGEERIPAPRRRGRIDVEQQPVCVGWIGLVGIEIVRAVVGAISDREALVAGLDVVISTRGAFINPRMLRVPVPPVACPPVTSRDNVPV